MPWWNRDRKRHSATLPTPPRTGGGTQLAALQAQVAAAHADYDRASTQMKATIANLTATVTSITAAHLEVTTAAAAQEERAAANAQLASLSSPWEQPDHSLFLLHTAMQDCLGSWVENHTCVVCMDQPRTHAFECGHWCICETCAQRVGCRCVVCNHKGSTAIRVKLWNEALPRWQVHSATETAQLLEKMVPKLDMMQTLCTCGGQVESMHPCCGALRCAECVAIGRDHWCRTTPPSLKAVKLYR